MGSLIQRSKTFLCNFIEKIVLLSGTLGFSGDLQFEFSQVWFVTRLVGCFIQSATVCFLVEKKICWAEICEW